jgi:hypothetical protein
MAIWLKIIVLGSPFWGFSDSLCYNLIHGAWTDALVVGPPEQDWIWVCFLSISCPLTPRKRLYGVEMVETGDAMDSKVRQENQGFPTNP